MLIHASFAGKDNLLKLCITRSCIRSWHGTWYKFEEFN